MTKLLRTTWWMHMKSCLFAGLAATFLLPAAGHSQAKIPPKWLECFAPNECEVRVFASTLHGRKGRQRLLAARSASACQAAGYSHYIAGNTAIGGYGNLRIFQRVYFTHDREAPARPCSFSATTKLEAEAMEIARANGYPWPVNQTAEATGWTFEPGENDWGEHMPSLDEIFSPVVPALRSDQDDLVGFLLLRRNCSVTLMVGQIGSEPESDWWAYWNSGIDLDDQILEVRVDGESVKEQGRNATKPTAGMVMSSRQTFGVYVRSAEHEDNAAFNWPVTDRDRETVAKHFPNCVS